MGRRTVNQFEMARLGRHVRNNHRRRDRLRDNNIRRLLLNLEEQRITISEFLVVAANYFNPLRDEDDELQINEDEINGNLDDIRAAYALIINPIVPAAPVPAAAGGAVAPVAAAPVAAAPVAAADATVGAIPAADGGPADAVVAPVINAIAAAVPVGAIAVAPVDANFAPVGAAVLAVGAAIAPVGAAVPAVGAAVPAVGAAIAPVGAAVPAVGAAVPAVGAAVLAPFDPVNVVNPPQRGRPRGRPRLVGGNRQARARGRNRGAAVAPPRQARNPNPPRGQQELDDSGSDDGGNMDAFRRNLDRLFEREHARFLERRRARDERFQQLRQMEEDMDFDHPYLNHIQDPINAPANPNLGMDIEPVNLVNGCTICYAEEAEYGLNTCPHRFCLTCINRFQPKICPHCRQIFQFHLEPNVFYNPPLAAENE